MEELVTLTMNKSSQVTIPVSVKKFLGLGDTGVMTARMRKDGVLEISREKSFAEMREEALAEMSPAERRCVDERMALMREKFPDLDERVAAEKNWRELPWNQKELNREIKKYGKY